MNCVTGSLLQTLKQSKQSTEWKLSNPIIQNQQLRLPNLGAIESNESGNDSDWKPPESTRIHPQTSISVGIYPKWNSFHESSPSNPGNFQQRCCDLPELRWWPSGRLECGYCHAINSCANEWKCANPHWPIPASTSLADSSIPPINQSINQSIRVRGTSYSH